MARTFYTPGAITAALSDAYTAEVDPKTEDRRPLSEAGASQLSAVTKLSMTSFRPAWSKSTVSFGPSVATTLPGPNLR